MIIKLSTTKKKRYDAVYENGIIVHFGSKNGSTLTFCPTCRDEMKRKRPSIKMLHKHS